MSFCSLTKGIIPKICILCVCVLIKKRSFEPFFVFGSYFYNSEDYLDCMILLPVSTAAPGRFCLNVAVWSLLITIRAISYHGCSHFVFAVDIGCKVRH